MRPLLALSIKQPWADMIVRGVKAVELRDWEMRHRGQVVLHASRTVDFPAAYLYGYRRPWALPLGRLIALADVVDVITFEATAHPGLLAQHRQPMPIQRGAYGVVLRNVRPLQPTIALRGQPYLFPLPEDIAQRVRNGIGSAAEQIGNPPLDS